LTPCDLGPPIAAAWPADAAAYLLNYPNVETMGCRHYLLYFRDAVQRLKARFGLSSAPTLVGSPLAVRGAAWIRPLPVRQIQQRLPAVDAVRGDIGLRWRNASIRGGGGAAAARGAVRLTRRAAAHRARLLSMTSGSFCARRCWRRTAPLCWAPARSDPALLDTLSGRRSARADGVNLMAICAAISQRQSAARDTGTPPSRPVEMAALLVLLRQ
jgi:hypothetical protein